MTVNIVLEVGPGAIAAARAENARNEAEIAQAAAEVAQSAAEAAQALSEAAQAASEAAQALSEGARDDSQAAQAASEAAQALSEAAQAAAEAAQAAGETAQGLAEAAQTGAEAAQALAETAQAAAEAAQTGAETAETNAETAQAAAEAARDLAAGYAASIAPGDPNGVAQLDGDSKLTESQRPDYVPPLVQAALDEKSPIDDYYETPNIVWGVRDANDLLGISLREDGKTDLIREFENLFDTGEADHSLVWGVRDANGRIGIGLRRDGRVTLIPDDQTAYDVGSDPRRFVWGVKDAAGYVALGVRATGEVYANLSNSGGQLAPGAIRGMEGEEVFGAHTYTTVLNRFFAPVGDKLAGLVQRRDILSTTAVLEQVKIKLTISYGQSLGVGGTDSPPDPIYTDKPLAPHQSLMLSTGVRGSGSTAAWNDTAVTDLLPAIEQLNATQSETPGCGYMARRILDEAARGGVRNVYGYFAAGAGGQNIDALAVGTQPWLNLLAGLDKWIEMAAIYGMAIEVDAFVITHGEANAATDPAIYKPKVEAIIAAFRSACDARGVSPEAGAVPVFMDQVSSPSGNTAGRTPNIAFAEIEASDSRAWVSTAKYMLTVTDGIHLHPADYRIMGEYIGRAADQVATTGDFKACRITDAEIVGDTVEVEVYVPSGDLVRDTSQVPAAANDGFRYFDDTSSATITGVTIGPTVANVCIITLQLSATPSGANPYITYGYGLASAFSEPNFGGLGNIRDSDTTESTVPAADAGNGYLPNWLLIQPPLSL